MPRISSPHATSHEDGGEDEVEFLELTDRLHASEHEDEGDDEINVLGLSGLLADEQTPLEHSTDKHDSDVLDTIVKMVAQLFCRIETGTYTGDGGVNHAITGVGFQPQDLTIGYDAGDTNEMETYRTDAAMQSVQAGCTIKSDANEETILHASATRNGVRSLDNDGFTLSDGAGDHHPNKNGQAYWYRALG